MSIEAIINRVENQGDDLVLYLRELDGQGLGQPRLIIRDYTHIPHPGQIIWGNSGVVLIEPGQGIDERRKYQREMYTTLWEMGADG